MYRRWVPHNHLSKVRSESSRKLSDVWLEFLEQGKVDEKSDFADENEDFKVPPLLKYTPCTPDFPRVLTSGDGKFFVPGWYFGAFVAFGNENTSTFSSPPGMF